MKKRKFGKVILFLQPTKTEKAHRITLPDLTTHWIPNQFVKSFNLYTKEIEIDQFILKQKGIKFTI